MAVHRILSLRLLSYLCFPLLLGFRFYRCFTYPPESANPTTRSSSRAAAGADRTTKKLRKPYTITKSRDRWTAEEHERFLDALLLFGRDWKKIEEFVGTKTTIQIRSHAQKYFIKVQKIGLAAHVPPPHPKRKMGHPTQQITPNNEIVSAGWPYASSRIPPACSVWDNTSNDINYTSNEATSLPACYTIRPDIEGDSGIFGKTSMYSQNIDWSGNFSGSLLTHRATKQRNPHPDFAQVYAFIGSMFDPNIPWRPELFFEKLQDVDPITAKIILILMRNLAANLTSPSLEPLIRWLGTYDANTRKVAAIGGTAAFADTQSYLRFI
ncbi:unnamed protein product [Musa textilis]